MWSKNAAASYYVELEWNTALALKKPVLPCRLDDTPLPQFLMAFNAIDCRNVEIAVPNILAALRLQTTETDTKFYEDVIRKLQSIKADDPKKVLREAKALFNQEARNVIGDVHQYHAERDLHVTIKKESWSSKIESLIEAVGSWIVHREMFWLFWSRSAMASKWVDWEWRTAYLYKGKSFIQPHPLEPFDMAPPPIELEELQFGNAFESYVHSLRSSWISRLINKWKVVMKRLFRLSAA